MYVHCILNVMMTCVSQLSGTTDAEGNWCSQVPRVLGTDTEGSQDRFRRGYPCCPTASESSKEEEELCSVVNIS